MRILHLIHQLSGGGAERQLCYLAPELVRLGHEVHVAYHKLGPDGDPDDFEGVNFHKLTPRGNLDPGLVLQIRRIIRTVNPDIIQTWILQMDVVGGFTAWWARTPWILREPCSLEAYPKSLKIRLRIWIANWSSGMISNSATGDDYWESNYPDKPRYIIANGFPVKEIEGTLPATDSELRAVGDQKVILFAGRLDAQKNLTTLINALSLVNQTVPTLALLCGEGHQREDLILQARSKGISESIRFMGFLAAPAVWALMKRADLFAHISLFEGFPNSVVEAMVCECPLLVSDIPEHREFLNSGNAVFTDPHDPKKVAESIFCLLSNREEAEERARNAKQAAMIWSIEEMARKYESAFSEILERDAKEST